MQIDDDLPDIDAEHVWSIESSPVGSAPFLSGGRRQAILRPDLKGLYVVERHVLVGASDTISHRFFVAAINPPPIADAGDDQTVLVGTEVLLDGTASESPDGTPLSYHWRLSSRPGGSTAELDDRASPTPSFVTDAAGIYTLELKVLDNENWSDLDKARVTANADAL